MEKPKVIEAATLATQQEQICSKMKHAAALGFQESLEANVDNRTLSDEERAYLQNNPQGKEKLQEWLNQLRVSGKGGTEPTPMEALTFINNLLKETEDTPENRKLMAIFTAHYAQSNLEADKKIVQNTEDPRTI